MTTPIEQEIAYLKAEIKKSEKDISDVENMKFWLIDWVYHLSTGEFSNVDIDREFDIVSKQQKRIRAKSIKSLIIDDILEPAGKRHGYYRLRNKNLKQMNFVNVTGKPFPLWLPFNIHEKVKIFPGNIIQINGEKNSGKTGFVLNIIKGNMDRHRVAYFNSEMGEQELNLRLSLDTTLSVNRWNFMAFERAGDFGDAIIPGEGTINIIDFLEVHDEFYKMGGYMRDIHDRLDGAIAIVCIQKNAGKTEFGLGGSRTEEKPRLILNLKPGTLKIKMAKNWVGSENPNGKCINFKLAQGIYFKQDSNWYYEKGGKNG